MCMKRESRDTNTKKPRTEMLTVLGGSSSSDSKAGSTLGSHGRRNRT